MAQQTALVAVVRAYYFVKDNFAALGNTAVIAVPIYHGSAPRTAVKPGITPANKTLQMLIFSYYQGTGAGRTAGINRMFF